MWYFYQKRRGDQFFHSLSIRPSLGTTPEVCIAEKGHKIPNQGTTAVLYGMSFMITDKKVEHHRLSLLELAQELSNVCQPTMVFHLPTGLWPTLGLRSSFKLDPMAPIRMQHYLLFFPRKNSQPARAMRTSSTAHLNPAEAHQGEDTISAGSAPWELAAILSSTRHHTGQSAAAITAKPAKILGLKNQVRPLTITITGMLCQSASSVVLKSAPTAVESHQIPSMKRPATPVPIKSFRLLESQLIFSSTVIDLYQSNISISDTTPWSHAIRLKKPRRVQFWGWENISTKRIILWQKHDQWLKSITEEKGNLNNAEG